MASFFCFTLLLTFTDSFVPPSTSEIRKINVKSIRYTAPNEHQHLRYTSLFSAKVDAVTHEEDDDDEDEGSNISQVQRVDNLRRLRRIVLSRRQQEINEQEDEARERQDIYFLGLALVPCILAFVTWDEISLSLAQFIEEHGAYGKTADGNQFAVNLLRPTITGIVVPVISIALATLVSTTINVLRNRQVELRALINKEACDLRLLRRAIFGMFGTRQHAGRRARALALTTDYVDQLVRECKSGAIASLEDVELRGGISTNELDKLSAMFHGVDGAAVSRQDRVGVADDAIARLNEYRSDRVALLLTDFPDLHWIVLAALSVSICVTFLLESNQLVNQYLNSIQLRSLFALLVGVFSATATLCLDLADPFTGSFSIVSASTQVGDLRVCLQEDIREANAEASEISSSTRQFFQSLFGGPTDLNGSKSSSEGANKNDDADGDSGSERESLKLSPKPTPSRYSILSTIYFHLLTGSLGSSVRALGDIAAWTATIIRKRTRAILSWRRWPWKVGPKAKR